MSSTIVVKRDSLRTWQSMKGWSDERLAREIGVSHAMLSHVMNGIRNPGNKFIAGLLSVSQCPFEAFFHVKN